MAERHVISIEVAANTAGAQSGIQSLARTTQNLDSLVSKLAIGSLFGTTIAGALGAFVANSAEAQESSVHLRHAIERLGSQAGVTEEQINNLAAGVQRVSKFSDESVKDAASALLLFDRVTGETFERTLKVSADLAAVMGTDIPQAAQQLGRALQLPGEGLRVLTQAGVKFTDDQVKLLQAMTETGHVAEAQGIILSELERRTRGAAEATSETLGGAIKQLSNQIGELLENEEGINRLTSAISGMAKAVASFSRSGTPEGDIQNQISFQTKLIELKEREIKERRANGMSIAGEQSMIDAYKRSIEDLQREMKDLQAPEFLDTRQQIAARQQKPIDPFAGVSAQAIADAQAKIDESRNKASEKALAESLARQKEQIDQWEEDLLRQGARAAQEERDAWIEADIEAVREYDEMMADIQKITDDFAQQAEASIADLTANIGDDIAASLENIRNPLVEFSDDLKANLHSIALSGKLTFRSLMDSIIHALLDRRLYDAIDKLGNALTDALSIGKGGGFLGFIGGLLDFSAGGGIIDRPTMVGEEGPELVFPGRGGASVVNMRQLAYAGGGGGGMTYAPSTTFNVTGDVDQRTKAEIISYIEQTRQRDQKGMLTMLYNNGFGRMR